MKTYLLKSIVGVLVLVLLGAGIYYAYRKGIHTAPAVFSVGTMSTTTSGSAEPSPDGVPVAQTAQTNTGTSVAANSSEQIPAGMKEYRNTKYHFSLLYPDSMTVAEFDEQNGARTITFQNVDAAVGFQIFVTPYSYPQISASRFKQDEPSGVQKNLANITVAGATAAMFDSTDAFLGDTHEIWFVHGGFLYETTTLKVLGSSLNAVINTWQFI